MDSIKALEKFSNTFKNLTDELKLIDEISNYYDDEVSNLSKPSMKTAEQIVKNVNNLNKIYDDISHFLSNKVLLDLVKQYNDNNMSFTDNINYLNDEKIKCGLLLEKYNKYIEKKANLFETFIDKSRVNNTVKYENLLKQQFRDNSGYNTDKDYSIIKDLIAWQNTTKQVGAKLIDQLVIYEKAYNIKPAEINKGLYDSLFYSNLSAKNWQIISPYSSTFGNKNYVKGELVYDFGLQIKEENKIRKIPNNIDTLVLYNPYNEKDIKDIINASYDLNIVFSVFGSLKENNYNEKQKQYYEVLNYLKEGDSLLLQDIDNGKDGKHYIKTIFSGKTK